MNYIYVQNVLTLFISLHLQVLACDFCASSAPSMGSYNLLLCMVRLASRKTLTDKHLTFANGGREGGRGRRPRAAGPGPGRRSPPWGSRPGGVSKGKEKASC